MNGQTKLEGVLYARPREIPTMSWCEVMYVEEIQKNLRVALSVGGVIKEDDRRLNTADKILSFYQDKWKDQV